MVEFRRKEELIIGEEEWHGVWMLKKVQKRRGMELFQYQALRDVLKQDGDKMKNFVAKFTEVKDQVSRDKNISIQYTSQGEDDVNNIMFISTNSLARKRCQEARNRRESNTRRQDSRGYDYLNQYDRSILQNCQDR